MQRPAEILNVANELKSDDALTRRVQRIAQLPGIAGPIVCLPDLHLKKRMEAPSSLATAVEGHIVPDLSSCSLNCGMGLIACGINGQDLTIRRLAGLVDAFRTSVHSSLWDLNQHELFDVAQRGISAVTAKYGHDDSVAQHVENGGAFAADPAAMDELLRAARQLVPDGWTSRLGTGIGGNHFVEIQTVKKVHDRSFASQWGLSEGQVVVMYHGGGGPLAGFMGRYFANRIKDSARRRARLFAYKLLYHFRDAKGWAHLASRLKYFSPVRFTHMRETDPETARLLTSISAGMNYGYAYRMAMVSRIMWAVNDVLGGSTPTTLVYDASHNSIQSETVGHRKLWVHRHNSCKIEPGRPLLVPGHHYAQSYLAVGGAHADRFLNSAPHGLGELVAADRKQGASTVRGQATLRFNNWEKEGVSVPHIHSASVERAFAEMEDLQLLRRTVELCPVAVLKDFRG